MKKMTIEERANKIINEARFHLTKYLNDCPQAKPRLGIYYRKKQWDWICEHIDIIEKVGENRRIHVELAKDGSKYLYAEYIQEIVKTK